MGAGGQPWEGDVLFILNTFKIFLFVSQMLIPYSKKILNAKWEPFLATSYQMHLTRVMDLAGSPSWTLLQSKGTIIRVYQTICNGREGSNT